MEKSTYIGLILAVIAVGLGMVLKGASLVSLANPAALLIIFGGTVACIFIGFPMEDLKVVPKLFKIMFTSQALVSKSELIQQIGEWATVSRREGLLSLESKAEEIDDEFLRNGMRMVIDGNDPEFIRDVLMENISAMEERHRQGALIFTQAGTYAPTLGVLGAVVGLIAALGNLNEIEALGHLISAAFVATLLGIFTGYVLWHPMANKLKQKSKKETQVKMMMAEGLLAIQAGEPVLSINQRLAVFLSSTERTAMEEKSLEKT
ncbi:flagellar motor stator protein MotA [Desulfosporosinus sp. BICA1-9]|uniref:flagellar motor stator protein MotA n=1 Tax=Desulfosporosinus sp. BICA1-9 TaxID=1531958 RepID=UPI00054C6AEB|nr:flagellar motor stator protein MotA [Desulfosporosinus sp. BICA1-9]KJS49614.1 MAG: flagellar motor protein MotA [Peptococcaceae bacterium BRH_c23]KJS77896.1 MAG: flagellar motor protein MotA [Desulfosporosinus sp. BICA1-9]HBW39197.1 flagellar motor protein MotA [Desulfosporosinus sp.]